MLRTIVGTAGHVDHGKTRLVEALTGIDCDRWQEEKQRGITIDIGFAHLREGDLQLGFVDVPGHERFVHNALAGLGGIRVLLLVVAADEGVAAQTREHLEICRLLGIPRAVVALTKRDLVDPDVAALAELEVAELLAATPWAAAPRLAVSALTGAGIPQLREALVDAARATAVDPDPTRPTRLPVDRAFHLKGLGALVTGTLGAGRIVPGDELEIVPGGLRARVRSLQVHGEERHEALPGERVSAQLSGVDLADLHRGQQLVDPGSVGASRALLLRYRAADTAPELGGWRPVRLHLLAAEVVGRLRPLEPPRLGPGEEGLVEARLAAPVGAARGDRFIARRLSPVETLGGGVVLDPAWRRPRGAARRRALERLTAGGTEALRYWVEEAAEAGITTADLARRLGVRPESLDDRLAGLTREGALLAVPGTGGPSARWVAPATVSRLVDRAGRVLGAYFGENRLAEGMPKAEAVRRIVRPRGEPLAGPFLAWLEAAGALVVRGDQVSLPGRKAEMSDQESDLAQRLLAAYTAAGLTPPSPAEVAAGLGAKPEIAAGLTKYLVRQRKLVQLPSGLLLSRTALDGLAADLRATGWERFTVPAFKERFGLSRKWAIPLLEQLDSEGVTRRAGDERLVVR